MTGAELVAVGVAQADEIAALHEEILGGGWSANSVARLLSLPSAFGFLACEPAGGHTIGLILCLPAGDAVDIAALGIAAPYRRRGVARRLVLAAGERARGSGAARLILEVAADNAPALALYRGLGFAAVARRHNYYERSGQPACDAVVLQKKLGPLE